MEETEDVILDTPNETVEETVETPTETEGETVETPAVDVDQLQATNKKLYERAKKAEADLKALKGTSTSPQPNIEETVLLATGMPEELLEDLKAIAAVRKVSLLKAQNDPLFLQIEEKFEKEQKHKEASVGASRGAGSVKPKVDFTTPGLSREEHMKLVKSMQQ